MDLVKTIEEIKINVRELERARSANNEVLDNYKKLIKRGTCFFSYVENEKICFAPSRFVGYIGNTFDKHKLNKKKDGRVTNSAITEIIGNQPKSNVILEKYYIEFCDNNKINPSKKGTFGVERKYWLPLDILEKVDNDQLSSVNKDSSLSSTEKEQLAKARIGQGLFRESLISYWKKCCLTGCELLSILKASHIKPWSVSNNNERLDMYNGLLLSPNADTLFDQGYITFEDDGELMVFKEISDAEINLLIGESYKKIKTNKKHAKYLSYHRENIFHGKGKRGTSMIRNAKQENGDFP